MNKNILYNYISQIYLGVVGVVFLPLYVHRLGEAAFGIVALNTMLQSCFTLLDIGMSQTLSRETTLYKNKAQTLSNYLSFFLPLQYISTAIALVGGGFIYFLSNYIATKWIDIGSLDVAEVVLCLKMTAITISLRWLSALNKGVVLGAEEFVWNSKLSIFISTIRYVGVIASMSIWGDTLLVFFIHQLVVVIIEFFIIKIKTMKLIPKCNETVPISFGGIKSRLVFAVPVALSAMLWIGLSQIDKVILSRTLSIDAYGMYSMASVAAGMLFMLATPITTTFIPKLTSFKDDHDRLFYFYRQLTVIMLLVIGSVGITSFFSGDEIIMLWTNDPLVAEKIGSIFSLIALGNAVLLLGGGAFCLQIALGNAKYHMIGYTLLLLIYSPLVIYFGCQGATLAIAWSWLIVSCIFTIFYIGYVHWQIVNIHAREWMVTLCRTLLIAFLVGGGYELLHIEIVDRFGAFLSISLLFIMTFSSIAFSNKKIMLVILNRR
ncbi:oligosaccharide flippase family protein [Aeromonas salmonicida]